MELEKKTETVLIISWTPPDVGGGAQEITGYDVTVNPGDKTMAVADTTVSITGLTSNTEYVVTVIARNEDNIEGMPSGDLVAVTRE